jgi:hypothetical protein
MYSLSQNLTDAQIQQLELRRKMLGRTRTDLLHRFEEALRGQGCVHTLAAARMRLDRVLNPRLRRPTSEATLIALASALGWTLLELEAALLLIEPATSVAV